MEFNTVEMVMCLSSEKLKRLKPLLNQWLTKESACKQQMLSLIRQLAHATKVVQPGRTFLHRMLDTAHPQHDIDYWIRISKEFKSDLMWWLTFIKR